MEEFNRPDDPKLVSEDNVIKFQITDFEIMNNINATNQEPNAQVISQQFLITGFDAGVSASIGNNVTSYSVNSGGGFGVATASITTVQNGDYVRIHGTASSNFGTTTIETLPVGDVNFTFSITTRNAMPTSIPSKRTIIRYVGDTTVGNIVDAIGEAPITYINSGGSDSSLFNVLSNGLITAISPLVIGTYSLEVTVNGVGGNAVQEITIIVYEAMKVSKNKFMGGGLGFST